jgi:hypothetical protein
MLSVCVLIVFADCVYADSCGAGCHDVGCHYVKCASRLKVIMLSVTFTNVVALGVVLRRSFAECL